MPNKEIVEITGNSSSEELRPKAGDEAKNHRIWGNGGNDTLYGGKGDDTLYGNGQFFGSDGNDALYGGEGDDKLYGQTGTDTLTGGKGDDTFVFNSYFVPGITTITDFTTEEDKIQLNHDGFNAFDDEFTAENFIEGTEAETAKQFILYDKNTGKLFYDADGNGAAGAVHFATLENKAEIKAEDITTDIKYIKGTEGSDKLSPKPENKSEPHHIYGLGGNDTLEGGAGHDTLDGGEGADEMYGGNGADIYYVDNINDRVIEIGLFYDSIYSTVTYTLPDNTEALYLQGNANIDGIGNNELNTIDGNKGDNILKGLDGEDTLDGHEGADKMYGGKGDDHYRVDNADDQVFEEEGEGDADHIQSSVTYTLPVNVEQLSLGGSAEIDGTGNAQDNTIRGNYKNNILKGLGGNDTLFGGSGNDSLFGGEGDDRLYGNTGMDTLNGGNGKDAFIFNTALDTDDIDLITDFTSGEDKIQLAQSVFTAINNIEEFTADNFITGTEAETASQFILYDKNTGKLFYDADGNGDQSAVHFATLANKEELKAEDITMEFISINGTEEPDRLSPEWIENGEKPHRIYGLGGNDTLSGGNGNDSLYGGGGDDLLYGYSSGKNRLYGGEGNDTIGIGRSFDSSTIKIVTGGAGMDIFDTDIYNSGGISSDNFVNDCTVTDFTPDEDVVVVSRGLGDGAFDSMGELAAESFIANDTGKAADAGHHIIYNTATGGLYIDPDGMGGKEAVQIAVLENKPTITFHDIGLKGYLPGGDGDDTLIGSRFTDILEGKKGADLMKGGDGNDRYIDVNVGDRIIENENGGFDTVFTSLHSYTLEENIEELVFRTDSGPVEGTGNGENNFISFYNWYKSIGSSPSSYGTLKGLDGNDTLQGWLSDDTLIGGAGSDYLVGDISLSGEGKDIFVFDADLGVNNIDTIADFTSGRDKIQLDRNIFTAMENLEVFTAENFIAETEATTADQFILYDKDTGKLFYDADGNGAGEAVQFAKLELNQDLKAEDILLAGKKEETPSTFSDTDGDGYLEINSKKDLITLSQDVNLWDKNFELTADIVFAPNHKEDWNGDGKIDAADDKGFTSIAGKDADGDGHLEHFSGNFNGNNHTISNLYINNSKQDWVGLFSSTRGGVISNIGLEDVNITGRDRVGALVGGASAGKSGLSKITNCYATGSVNGGYTTPITNPNEQDLRVGGLLGIASNGDPDGSASLAISNCYASVTTTGHDGVGGLIGWTIGEGAGTLTIENCYATGDVIGNRWSGGLLGSVIAEKGGSLSVDHCYTTGNVSDTDSNGGLIGLAFYAKDGKSLTVSNSFSPQGKDAIGMNYDVPDKKEDVQVSSPATSKEKVIKHLVGLRDSNDKPVWTNKNGSLDNPVFGTEPSVFDSSTPINNGTVGDQTLGKDKLTGKEDKPNLLEGLAGDDTLIGGNDNDTLYGNQDNDLLESGKGDDFIFGGTGNDILNGGDGGDFLQGNQGKDSLAGDEGHDVLYGGADEDLLDGGNGMDILFGSKGNDTLYGKAGADFLQGNSGDDLLSGGLGVDSFYGGQGNDTLKGEEGDDYLFGSKGNDSVLGGLGADFLQGNEGNDILIGGEGDDIIRGGQDNDTLVGGAGRDTLYGDKGSDVYLFEVADAKSADVIGNFLSGEDNITLKAEKFGLAAGQLDAGAFVASADGSAVDADDRILYNTTTGALSFDADGNGAGVAVQFAVVEEKSELKATDFLVA